MKEVKSGFAFHVHHDMLVEFCTDYDDRVDYIKEHKPEGEQELRLRLFKLIPVERLPVALNKAWEAHDKAREAYDKVRESLYKARESLYKAWESRNKAREAYDKVREANHKVREAYDKVRESNDKALKDYESDFIQLHNELCPNCSWNGYSIFSNKEG